MPRKGSVPKRELMPDAVYNSVVATKFIQNALKRGKKVASESIFYGAMDAVKAKAKKEPMEVLQAALRNVSPLVEVKPRRVGGATYQVPVEVKPDRGSSLAVRWILENAGKRSGKSMIEKLSGEILDASNGTGASVKKREDVHKMAEANKAFAHYRW